MLASLAHPRATLCCVSQKYKNSYSSVPLNVMILARAYEEKRACNSQRILCMRHIIDEPAGYAILAMI